MDRQRGREENHETTLFTVVNCGIIYRLTNADAKTRYIGELWGNVGDSNNPVLSHIYFFSFFFSPSLFYSYIHLGFASLLCHILHYTSRCMYRIKIHSPTSSHRCFLWYSLVFSLMSSTFILFLLFLSLYLINTALNKERVE